MPKAYWVVTYRSVKNPEAWKAYARRAGDRRSRRPLSRTQQPDELRDRASPIGKRIALVGGRDLTLRVEENFGEGLEE